MASPVTTYILFSENDWLGLNFYSYPSYSWSFSSLVYVHKQFFFLCTHTSLSSLPCFAGFVFRVQWTQVQQEVAACRNWWTVQHQTTNVPSVATSGLPLLGCATRLLPTPLTAGWGGEPYTQTHKHVRSPWFTHIYTWIRVVVILWENNYFTDKNLVGLHEIHTPTQAIIFKKIQLHTHAYTHLLTRLLSLRHRCTHLSAG